MPKVLGSFVAICVLLTGSGANARDIREEFLLGQQRVDHMISVCQAMRSGSDHEMRLPKEFDFYLRDSVQKLRADSSASIPEAQVQILSKEAEDLIKQDRLTLYEWNVFHFRMAKLFSHYKHKHDSQTSFPLTSDELKVLRTQTDTKNILEHPKENIPVATSFRIGTASLKISQDGTKCPFAMYGDLGIIPLNYAFAHNVHPIGVTSKSEYFDGFFDSPEAFFRHDLGHADGNSVKMKSRNFQREIRKLAGSAFHGSPIEVSRKIYAAFLESIKRLSADQQEKIHTIAFLDLHEVTYDAAGYTVFCTHDHPEIDQNKFWTRFLHVSNLNLVLPKNLQGSVSLMRLLEPDPSRTELGPGDRVHKDEQILAYLEDARVTYCKAWEVYLDHLRNENLSDSNSKPEVTDSILKIPEQIPLLESSGNNGSDISGKGK